MLNIKPNQYDSTQENSSSGLLLVGIFFLSMFGLAACGGGAKNSENPGSSGSTGGSSGGFVYSGNPAASTDAILFQSNLYNFIAPDNVCGQCHASGGQGTGEFADPNDVNLAYNEATLGNRVNLSDPAQSGMVTKFRNGGHFCWLPTNEDCANSLEGWITNWRDAINNSSARGINLVAPNSIEPQGAISFPSTAPASFTELHNLVSTHCIRCHVPSPANGAPAQQPYFAQADAAASYSVISQTAGLVNLTNPLVSRFYVRLNTDSHNCWDVASDAVVGPNCTESANLMLTAINNLISEISSSGSAVDLSQVTASRAVNLFDDGIAAAGGNRYEPNLVALYEFKERQGNIAADTSSLAPAANLTLQGVEGVDYQRLSSWGVRFMHDSPNPPQTVMGFSTNTETSKIANAIRATGQYSIELWVIPDNINDQDRTILSYSTNSANRNFNLSQYEDEYFVYNNTNENSDDPTDTLDGAPVLSSGDGVLQATLQHIVVTYDQINGRKIYVDGQDTGATDPSPPSGLSIWDELQSLTIGNSFDNTAPWKGTIKMLAIHDQAMTLAQVQQNFSIDVGQKYYLLFDISHHLGADCQGPDVITSDALPYEPLCFVYAEVAQFDDYSYLINQPHFVVNTADSARLNSILSSGIQIKGIRIGVNGREAESGQAFVAVNSTVNSSEYNLDASVGLIGQKLSNIGTVIANEFGPVGTPADELFMTFEILGGQPDRTAQYNVTVATSLPNANPPVKSDLMIRTFEEINASMAQATGVDRTTGAIVNTYNSVIQGLPGSFEIDTFVPAHQMAISQLAIEYCSALIDDNGTTIPVDSYFPNINFSTVNSSGLNFDATTSEDVVNPLLERTHNAVFTGSTVTNELLTQADTIEVRNELVALIGRLTQTGCTGTSCPPARTKEIMKATCAATVASSAMLIQ